MRLRLPLLSGALAAVALSASPAPAAEVAGCSSAKPPAAGKAKPSFKKPATILAKGRRYAIAMTTSCGVIRIVLDRALGGPIPNSVAFLSGKHFFDGLTIPRVIGGYILQGGDPRGDGTGDPGYAVVGALPRSYRYKIGDVAMAKTSLDPSGTAGSQFFVISGSEGTQLAPDYGLLGHAVDAASLATIGRIDRLATTACGNPNGCPPTRKVWITGTRLIRLP